jgi:hypothetical protein
MEFRSSVAGQTFTDKNPLILYPGDAFVVSGVRGQYLHIDFGYDEIDSGVVDANAFPAGSVEVVNRSDNVEDESLSDEAGGEKHFMVDASYHSHSGHSHGSDCALTPHRPGCCLAAVKYELRDEGYVRGDLSNFPGVYGKFATANLPSNFVSVGCGARKQPRKGLTCSYNSSFNPEAGPVETYTGSCWYFGLGCKSIANDGYHTCIDCKAPR